MLCPFPPYHMLSPIPCMMILGWEVSLLIELREDHDDLHDETRFPPIITKKINHLKTDKNPVDQPFHLHFQNQEESISVFKSISLRYFAMAAWVKQDRTLLRKSGTESSDSMKL